MLVAGNSIVNDMVIRVGKSPYFHENAWVKKASSDGAYSCVYYDAEYVHLRFASPSNENLSFIEIMLFTELEIGHHVDLSSVTIKYGLKGDKEALFGQTRITD